MSSTIQGSLLQDAEIVIAWAVWDVRVSDLPEDVRAAVERLATAYPRGKRVRPRATSYARGDYRMSVFPDSSSDLIESWPLDVGSAVNNALKDEPLYLLVCNTREAVAEGWESPSELASESG